MREHHHPKIVFASLKAYGRDIAYIFFSQHLAELFESAARKRRQRLRHVGNIAEGKYAAAAVSELADVLASSGLFQFVDELGRKSALYGRKCCAPALRNANDCTTGL